MPDVLRIIDANANRAREALRVMEETARFILDDRDLTTELKSLRHDLATALRCAEGLEANRDMPRDVGRAIKTSAEMRRQGVIEVVVAAGKRLSEALRAIEEYAKTLREPVCGLAAVIERLRYRGYDLEKKLNLALATGRASQWRLCVLISESLCPGRDWLAVAAAAADAGADCLQLREKSLDGAELLRRARTLVSLCRPRQICVIVNDRPDIAHLSQADGVHLGQADVPCHETRRLVGRQLLIGVSTSTVHQARDAIRAGADYCGIGPMYASTTKTKKRIAGPAYAKAFRKRFPNVPHLAIGGIMPDTVDQLVAVGVQGVAVSSAVCAAPNPGAVVKRLLLAWH